MTDAFENIDLAEVVGALEHPDRVHEVESRHLERAVRLGIALYGATHDRRLEEGALALYGRFLSEVDQEGRWALYQSVSNDIDERRLSAKAIEPFALEGTETSLVSLSTMDDVEPRVDVELDFRWVIEVLQDPRMVVEVAGDQLERLTRLGILALGTTGDGRLAEGVMALTRRSCEELERFRRQDLCSSAFNDLSCGWMSADGLLTTVLAETDPDLVALSTMAMVRAAAIEVGDAVAPAARLCEAWDSGSAACRVGIFAGLMCFGEAAILELLTPLRRHLSEEELAIVENAHEAFTFVAVLDFMVDWLEEAEERADEETFRVLASMLAAAPALLEDDGILATTGLLSGSGGPKDGIELGEYGARIGERLLAVAAREQPPQAMPPALEAWGFDLPVN